MGDGTSLAFFVFQGLIPHFPDSSKEKDLLFDFKGVIQGVPVKMAEARRVRRVAGALDPWGPAFAPARAAGPAPSFGRSTGPPSSRRALMCGARCVKSAHPQIELLFLDCFLVSKPKSETEGPAAPSLKALPAGSSCKVMVHTAFLPQDRSSKHERVVLRGSLCLRCQRVSEGKLVQVFGLVDCFVLISLVRLAETDSCSDTPKWRGPFLVSISPFFFVGKSRIGSYPVGPMGLSKFP